MNQEITDDPIEEFGKKLVELVRDEAIRLCDMNLSGGKGPEAKRWRELVARGNPEEIAHALIPDIVDQTLAQLLYEIDNEELKISFTASDGTVLYLPKDGKWELCGWYVGTEGWREAYSKRRFVDDFADLKDFKFDDNEG